MPSDSNNYSDLISRRRFVELTGVSGAAALAGCDGGDGDGTPTPTESDGGDMTPDDETPGDETPTETSDVQDKTFVAMTNSPPDDTHFWQVNQQNYDWATAWNVTERLLAWNFVNEEFESAALSNWELDGTTLRMEIRDDMQWEDGDEVTADDLILNWNLQTMTDGAVSDFTEEIEAVDDKTVEVTMPGENHQLLVGYELENFRIFAKADEHGDWTDESAENIQTHKLREDVISNSAWSVTGVSSQDWTMERNDNFYNADNVNWSNKDLVLYDSNPAQQQALIGGEDVDSAPSLFCPPEVVAQFPDNVLEINLPAKWGYGTIFSHDHEHFGERAVRQAVAYVVNRQTVVDNSGPLTKFPTSHPCGIAPQDIETWVGDDLENFDSYGPESSDTESATGVLEDAGYSQVDGTWENGDGSAVSANYATPAGWTDFTTATTTVVDQLSEFGFDISTESVNQNDLLGSRYPDGNFAIGAMHWLPGEARSSFPYFPLRFQVTQGGVSGGHNYPGEESVSVPAMGGDGELSIEPANRIADVAQTTSNDEAEPIIREVAYHNNQDLPFLSLMSKWEQSWLAAHNGWSISEAEEDRQVKWPTIWMPKQGTLQAE